MGEFSDRVIANMRFRIELELSQVGDEMVVDIQQAISTPVGRDSSGNVIERSAPGEDPWLDTGILQASENSEVVNGSTELNVFNTAEYARRLNCGHGNVAPRPFHDFAIQRWFPVIPQRILSAAVGK
jgi:hypothetical protein